MPLPPRRDNPYFPLVPDYGELTAEGQRQARVSLMTSWFNPKDYVNLISDPEAFVYAARFFREYYRKGHPGNFHKYPFEDAPMHKEWPVLISRHPLLLVTSFRGSAKTLYFGEELPEMLMVCRPRTAIQYTSAADDLTLKQVRAIRLDLETNDLILRDFGDLRGRRPLTWSGDLIECSNGSSFKGVSSDSRQRGTTQMSVKPNVQILDDPEVDLRVRNPKLRHDFGHWLFHVFFPSAEPYARRIWTNTLLSVRCWAMKALHGEDPRFDGWFKARYDIWKKRPDGSIVSAWPSRLPTEVLQRMFSERGEAGLIAYGAGAFRTEFLNEPSASEDAAFAFDKDRHTFTILDDRILHNGSIIPLEKLRRESITLVGVDLSLGFESSDPSAIVVASIDPDNVLWVVDAWSGTASPIDVLHHALFLADQWHASSIGVERVAFEKVAIDMLRYEMDKRRSEGRYAPNVCEVVHAGGAKKEVRALCLQFRFTEDKIRIRKDLNALIEQVSSFTLLGGTFSHDDLLDALVAIQEMLQTTVLPQRRDQQPIPEEVSWSEARRLGVLPQPGSDRITLDHVRRAVAMATSPSTIRDEGDGLSSIAGGWTDMGLPDSPMGDGESFYGDTDDGYL